ncbi:MAG: hypothetical protein P1V81_10135 [Planctomycetota bacterium]|nr:hypothetical protein [Planctomycetota bacterium]
MNQRSYAIGLIALAPLLLAKSCPDSKGKSIEATTNDFEIEAVDANIANNQLSASGIQFRRKPGNSQQMTDAEITFWDDVDGDGVAHFQLEDWVFPGP